jgi:hypothetical protein
MASIAESVLNPAEGFAKADLCGARRIMPRCRDAAGYENDDYATPLRTRRGRRAMTS